MKLRSDFREAVTITNHLHRESAEKRPEPIPVHQYQRWHSSSHSSSSGMKTGGAHNYFVVARSFTADGNLLQPTGSCEQNTLTSHIFSCLRACLIMSHTTLAQGVSARHTIHVSCACVSDLSSTLHFALFTVSPVFLFILLISFFFFHVGRFGEK